MNESPEQPQPSRHIAWQEVIELDSVLPKEEQELLTQYLLKIERSVTGQQYFAKQLALQKIALQQMGKPAVVTPDDSPYDGSLLILTPESFHKRRRYDTKLFLSVVGEDLKDTPAYDDVIRDGGAGYYGNGLILLHLPTLAEPTLAMTTADGVKQLMPFTVDQAIMHEISHALDDMEVRWVKTVQAPSIPCGEERALRVENAYLKEQPNSAHRHTYYDLDFLLGSMIQFTPDGTQVPSTYRLESAMDAVTKNAGCKGIKEEQAKAQAAAILKKHGITAIIDPRPPESAPAAPANTPVDQSPYTGQTP